MALIMKVSKRKLKQQLMTEIGKLGGETTLERHGTNYFSELSRKRKHFRGGRKPNLKKNKV